MTPEKEAKRRPSCKNCGTKATRNDKHDAYYCERCDVWVEGQCSDSTCGFCGLRPEKPSLVVK